MNDGRFQLAGSLLRFAFQLVVAGAQQGVSLLPLLSGVTEIEPPPADPPRFRTCDFEGDLFHHGTCRQPGLEQLHLEVQQRDGQSPLDGTGNVGVQRRPLPIPNAPAAGGKRRVDLQTDLLRLEHDGLLVSLAAGRFVGRDRFRLNPGPREGARPGGHSLPGQVVAIAGERKTGVDHVPADSQHRHVPRKRAFLSRHVGHHGAIEFTVGVPNLFAPGDQIAPRAGRHLGAGVPEQNGRRFMTEGHQTRALDIEDLSLGRDGPRWSRRGPQTMPAQFRQQPGVVDVPQPEDVQSRLFQTVELFRVVRNETRKEGVPIDEQAIETKLNRRSHVVVFPLDRDNRLAGSGADKRPETQLVEEEIASSRCQRRDENRSIDVQVSRVDVRIVQLIAQPHQLIADRFCRCRAVQLLPRTGLCVAVTVDRGA